MMDLPNGSQFPPERVFRRLGRSHYGVAGDSVKEPVGEPCDRTKTGG